LRNVGIGAYHAISGGITCIPGKSPIANDRMIVYIVAGRKIYIVLVGLKINARHNRGIGQYIAVPLVKGRFSGFYPRSIGYWRGFVQIGDDIALYKSPYLVSDQ